MYCASFILNECGTNISTVYMFLYASVRARSWIYSYISTAQLLTLCSSDGWLVEKRERGVVVVFLRFPRLLMLHIFASRILPFNVMCVWNSCFLLLYIHTYSILYFQFFLFYIWCSSFNFNSFSSSSLWNASMGAIDSSLCSDSTPRSFNSNVAYYTMIYVYRVLLILGSLWNVPVAILKSAEG